MARKKKRRKNRKKITELLQKSVINYFSDLFVASMVVAWIAVLIIMIIMAIWATIVLCDTSIWCYVWELTGIPLTAGGAIWMIKNSVQHAIANNRGELAPMDFPAVNAEGQDEGVEKEMSIKNKEEIMG